MLIAMRLSFDLPSIGNSAAPLAGAYLTFNREMWQHA